MEQTKWIFAVDHPGHRDLREALTALRANGGVQAVRIQLGFDHGPRSKQAKVVETLFQKGMGKDSGAKQKSKRARM